MIVIIRLKIPLLLPTTKSAAAGESFNFHLFTPLLLLGRSKKFVLTPVNIGGADRKN